jgi:hypothetical protein
VAGTEVLAGLRVISTDLHVGVTKPDNLLFASLAGLHNGFLATLNITARLIALHPLFG